MKAQTKLSLVLFVFGLTIFLCASLFFQGLGFLPGSDSSLSVTSVLLFIAVIAISGFSYLIALTVSSAAVSFSLLPQRNRLGCILRFRRSRLPVPRTMRSLP